MNLDKLNLVELNVHEKLNVFGGSWLSRQWDSIKQYVVDAIVEYALTNH
jgi:hypothetical protein